MAATTANAISQSQRIRMRGIDQLISGQATEREAGKSGTNEKRGSALSKRRRGLLVGLRFVTRFEFGAARVGDSVRTGNLGFQFGMRSQKTSIFSAEHTACVSGWPGFAFLIDMSVKLCTICCLYTLENCAKF